MPQYKETSPVITLLDSRRTCGTYRRATNSCKMDVTLDYIIAETVLRLRVTITISTSFTRQTRSTAAQSENITGVSVGRKRFGEGMW